MTYLENLQNQFEKFVAQEKIGIGFFKHFCNGLSLTIKIVLYYLDLIKDIVLCILLLKNVNLSKSFTTFESQITILSIISLFSPYLFAYFCIKHLLVLKTKSQIILSYFTPISPAIGYYMIGRLSYDQKKTFNFDTQLEILNWKKTCYFLKIIESTFENSIQIFILVFVILLKSSDSKTIHGLVNLISNDEADILALSGLWSLASMVVTEVQWYSSSKNFYLSFKAKVTYGLHMFLFVIKRVFCVILYFAPLMGIFDLMGHWKMGKPKFKEVIEKEVCNISQISMEIQSIENWTQINDYSEMTNWKLTYYYILFILLIFFHLILLFLLKCKFAKNFLGNKNIFEKVFHTLIQLFCPKVYQDWDEGISTVNDVIQNFRRVKQEFMAMLILFLFEDLVMCAPIWILSYNIYQRNIYLEQEGFPKVFEERWSTLLAYALATVCPVAFIVFSFLQYKLFCLYNKFCHPWCILLREKTTIPTLFEERELNLDGILTEHSPAEGPSTSDETKASNMKKIVSNEIEMEEIMSNDTIQIMM